MPVIEDRLRYILGFVDGHVKFAETKNAALFAANAAALFVILQVLSGAARYEPLLRTYLWILTIGCLLSAAACLLSFLPVTQIPWIQRTATWAEGGNLLFFGSAQRFAPDRYVRRLRTISGLEDTDPNLVELMYAEQIIANSKIASRKFFYCKVAMWFTLGGALTPVVALPLLLWSAGKEL